MTDKLLSISEAAKLLEVCENTLRDWDIEAKLKADRSAGGHRRYSLDQIREYLEKNPLKEKSSATTENILYNKSLILKRWQDLGYLPDSLNENEKTCLAVLLDNANLMHKINETTQFSSQQILWLTQQSWLRCRFKKMVSVQPLLGPCGMAYYENRNKNNVVVKEEAVAAKTSLYNLRIFTKANFDYVKELYADCIAAELDIQIAKYLPRFGTENICNLEVSLSRFDYLIVPDNMIENVRNNQIFQKIDIYNIPSMLDKDSFELIGYGGKYPTTNYVLPILMPYILISDGLDNGFQTKSLIQRSGWFAG